MLAASQKRNSRKPWQPRSFYGAANMEKQWFGWLSGKPITSAPLLKPTVDQQDAKGAVSAPSTKGNTMSGSAQFQETDKAQMVVTLGDRKPDGKLDLTVEIYA